MHEAEGPGLAVPGWFGKIATRGDFVQRRWPPALVRTCDVWLSRAMRDGPARLGERWWPAYLNAPLLRFAWSPGVVDGAWWFGVLMSSCDDVGRYFPLVIAAPGPGAPRDAAWLAHLDRWQDQLADAATATLAGGSLEGFEAALQGAPAWPPETAAAEDRGPSSPVAPFDGPFGATGWWCRPLREPGTRVHRHDGLPEGARFADLLAMAGEEAATDPR